MLFIREYKRRTLVDRKDLLVKIKTPGLNVDNDDDDDDDEDIRNLRGKQEENRLSSIDDDDDESERKLTSIDNGNEILVNSQRLKQTNQSDSSYDVLTDSSSSIADDETARINELCANVGDKIDGKQRIKVKGDKIKIKGRPNKQRTKIIDSNYFQLSNQDMNTENTAEELELNSFDFLYDHDE